MDIKLLDSTYIEHTYKRTDAALVSGAGAYFTGEDGKRYLDFCSGIAVNTLGNAHAAWTDAVIAQVKQLAHTSNYFATAPGATLAKTLCERTGMQRVFFSNSGAEANECAIKCARKYSFDRYGAGRHTLVTLKNSFHGRTLATLSATGQDVFHAPCFAPFVDGFVHAEPNDFEDLLRVCTKDVCAVLVELIQGEGGICVLNEGYVKRLAALCAERDILLILDEVQTGNGRTGTLYAFEQYGISPDILTTAKGLAGGLPLGATLFSAKTAGVLTGGTHGSTFGGNPICCAAANAVLSELNAMFLKSVSEKGKYLKAELSRVFGQDSVNGLGLMLGIKVSDASELMQRARKHGMLVLTAKDKLRLLPPLTVTYAELDEGIKILTEIKNI